MRRNPINLLEEFVDLRVCAVACLALCLRELWLIPVESFHDIELAFYYCRSD